MSRFDMLGSWMQGSQLGQQQYGQLAGMAQNEAMLRQRQAEEAAQQEQFAARQALDQQQFGEHQRMNTATLGRWDQQTAWENQDRAREEAIRQEEQQRLGFMRDWMKERARSAAGGAMRGARGMLPPEAMNAGGMMGGDATAFLPADITGAASVEPPETQKFMRMIDHADGAGLKAMMPYLDSIEQQRKLTKMVEGIDSHIGSASMLKDPNHRAIFQAYKNARDPEGMMRTMNAAMQSMEKQQFEQQRQANAMEIAKFRALHGQGIHPGKIDATRLRALQDRYRALTGKGGKNGPLMPPTADQIQLVKDAADAQAKGTEFNVDTGFWDITGPDPEDLDKAQQQVALWNEMQAMLGGSGAAPTTPASEDIGAPQPADPETIYQQIMAEMPNATDEQAAAELARRMQGG